MQKWQRHTQSLVLPGEEEILLLPGFCYEVTSNVDVGNGLTMIGLKEVDP